MSSSNDIQVDQVLGFVAADESRSCAIVHVQSKVEVILAPSVNGDGYEVTRTPGSQPSEEQARALGATGIKVQSRQYIPRFGPNSGKAQTVCYLRGEFRELPEAASAALRAVRLLAGVAADEPLWITKAEYDMRGDPPGI